MANVFVINGHQPSDFSAGELNAELADMAAEFFADKGWVVRTTAIAEGYDVDTELGNHQWADLIVLQTPVNWMGVPWSCKKYMDEVYTAGMNGELCDGDGRNRSDPDLQYGSGGTLGGKKYMLSLTLNAPAEAFGDKKQYLFAGKSVDELFFPAHMNFRFFAMDPMATFACFDVLKNPQMDADFERFEAHLEKVAKQIDP